MNEKIQNSINTAASYLALDHTSIIVLDDTLGIWIGYVLINGVRILIFAQDVRIFGISEVAEKKLRDWVLGQ